MKQTPVRRQLDERFTRFAQRLSTNFPELDLRFGRAEGSSGAVYLVPEHSDETFEIDLKEMRLDDLINEAIMNVKAVARQFDS